MSEKDYNPEQKNAKAMKQQEKSQKAKIVETQKEKKVEDTKSDDVEETTPKGVPQGGASSSSSPRDISKEMSTKGNKEENKTEKKKVKQKSAPKKEEVAVNAREVPVSTKVARAICRFIKWKTIEQATLDLEKVMKKIKAVPMRGEIAHRKGKIMSGKFPIRASEQFILILKSLKGNAIQHDLENPIIFRAMANKAPSPLGRFGTVKRKRTHITLKARTKIERKTEKTTPRGVPRDISQEMSTRGKKEEKK